MIAWLIEALIASALLMAIVLVIRAPARRAFGPGITYALWALPAIRLALPPLPRFSWHDTPAPMLAQRASETLNLYVIEPLGGSAAAPTSLYSSLGLPLAVLWGVGAAAFLGWHALKHWHFCRRMIAGSTHSERNGTIEVIETAAASGPLAFGIFRRYVAFPRDFSERYDADERQLALLHELGHHQRGDLIANWIALAVLALHWFNPLAWRAFRAFRTDQEMANDARVLAGRTAIERHAYACAIVKAAHGGAVSAACHLHTINDLKGRLRMLTTGPRSRLTRALGATAVAALMIGGLGLTASGTAAAASVRAGVEKATGIDIANIDMKLQSTPPAPPAPGADLPEPPAPPTGWAAPDGKDVVTIERTPDGKMVKKRMRIIMRDKNGDIRTEDFGDMPPPTDVPEVASMDCPGPADNKEMVLKSQQGAKGKIIICTNRIERMVTLTADRAGKSKDIQRQAYRSALDGLRASRARMAAKGDMAGWERKAAIDGIDEAIKELEADLAEVN